MTEETLFYEGSGVDTVFLHSSLAHEGLIMLILHIQGEAWRGDIKTERGGGGGGETEGDRETEGRTERKTDRRTETDRQRDKERDRGNPNSKTLFSKEYSFG